MLSLTQACMGETHAPESLPIMQKLMFSNVFHAPLYRFLDQREASLYSNPVCLLSHGSI